MSVGYSEKGTCIVTTCAPTTDAELVSYMWNTLKGPQLQLNIDNASAPTSTDKAAVTGTYRGTGGAGTVGGGGGGAGGGVDVDDGDEKSRQMRSLVGSRLDKWKRKGVEEEGEGDGSEKDSDSDAT